MTAAHRAAEKLRDNYRYYPLANSNGYGLGENEIGWVRDLVVRGDELGNKIVDQYNRGTVTTTTYDKDGNFVNRYTGGEHCRTRCTGSKGDAESERKTGRKGKQHLRLPPFPTRTM